MKKRYFSLLFITALICLVLVGCGNASSSDTPDFSQIKEKEESIYNTPEAVIEAFQTAYNNYDDDLMREIYSDELFFRRWGDEQVEDITQKFHESLEYYNYSEGASFDKIHFTAYTIEPNGESEISYYGEFESGGKTFPAAFTTVKIDEEWKFGGLLHGDGYFVDSSGIMHTGNQCPEIDDSGSTELVMFEKDALDKGYKRCKVCL